MVVIMCWGGPIRAREMRAHRLLEFIQEADLSSRPTYRYADHVVLPFSVTRVFINHRFLHSFEQSHLVSRQCNILDVCMARPTARATSGTAYNHSCEHEVAASGACPHAVPPARDYQAGGLLGRPDDRPRLFARSLNGIVARGGAVEARACTEEPQARARRPVRHRLLPLR